MLFVPPATEEDPEIVPAADGNGFTVTVVAPEGAELQPKDVTTTV